MKPPSSIPALILVLGLSALLSWGGYHLSKLFVSYNGTPFRTAPLVDSTLPNPTLTPGARRQGATVEELCDPKFRTGTVRNVTEKTKQTVRAAYGMTSDHDKWCNTASKCEIDHLIALILGGSNDPTNLWPQAYEGTWNAHHKDQLEVRLHHMVCERTLALADAQQAIATNWIAAYKRYVNPTPTLGDRSTTVD